MSLDVQTLSWDAYRAFLAGDDCPPVSLYHHPLWLKSVEDGLGIRAIILGLYERGDLIGVLPGFLVRKGPVRLFGSPMKGTMTPYLGWLYRDGRGAGTEATLEHVFRFCSGTLRCGYVQIGLHESPADMPPDTPPAGWHVEHPETYVVDLRPGEAALWTSLGHRERNKVSKATKSGVVIEPVTGREGIRDFYAMLRASFGRHQAVPPHPERFYQALDDHLAVDGRMEILAAKQDGHPIAMAVLVSDEREVCIVSSASLAEYHQLRPNNLLYWHVISHAARRGVAAFDLGGKGLATIDHFKESFNPAVHAYTFFWRAGPLLTFGRRMALRAWPRVQRLRYHARRLFTPRPAGRGPDLPAAGGTADAQFPRRVTMKTSK